MGVLGGTKNGTWGARIKILRPLFNANTPPKTPFRHLRNHLRTSTSTFHAKKTWWASPVPRVPSTCLHITSLGPGTDSCDGDSCGGLYVWRKEKPILVSVVSPGFGSDLQNGCAERYFPPTYTAGWAGTWSGFANKQTKDGNCCRDSQAC